MDEATMALTHSLLDDYETVRRATQALYEPLSEEDCCVQSMTDASPIKWHLAHTSWFFETFVLEKYEPNFAAFHPAFRMLFNSYYNSIGDKHPRPQRGLITRPSLAEVEDYRSNVDARIEALLLLVPEWSPEDAQRAEDLIVLGLHHEQQHQELMMTDVKHLLWHNPLKPPYHPRAPLAIDDQPRELAPMVWPAFDEGVVAIGHNGEGFCYDNETPRHRQFLEPFSLGSRLVSNGEYVDFINDGGYERPELWLSEGWDWLHAAESCITMPLYWEKRDGRWLEYTLHGMKPLCDQGPAVHLSYFEADAYARWAGARLPTEFEWEHAIMLAQRPPNGAGSGPESVITQVFDTAWQWTSSSYMPYPRFKPRADAVGEYNAKFMVNQYVLRGASCVTPLEHSRATYRNFFPSHARWQFTGIRLARSL